MKSLLITSLALWTAAATATAADVHVTEIKAASRDGQTFVTWKDAAEGEAGAAYRYSLYRSDAPITQENLAQAELCYPGVPNNSAKQFGHAFWMKDRLDPEQPTAVIEEGGEPLPMWSGLAVRTVVENGDSYYAVVATDEEHQPLGGIVPGVNATTKPVAERVAPIQPIKIGDSKVRGTYARVTQITGEKNLPLALNLHGSSSRGGAAGDHGDLYIYFGTPAMGWRDGMPGIFSISESPGEDGRHLTLRIRDAIESAAGTKPVETCWFGYFCVPVGAKHTDPRAYPFTENRVEWIVQWVTEKYHADPQRVYSSGQSMGGMGSTHFAFRHPEMFAAVYPRLGRVRQTWLPVDGPGGPGKAIHRGRWNEPAPMFDGQTDYFERMDMVKWAREHHEDLPFYGWCFGRTDGVAPWEDQIEMVKTLTENHHGFAFSWNNHGHSSDGAKAMQAIVKYYPQTKFALDESYPAFGNSSIDDDMGAGARDDGDLVGGINLGFHWSDVVDEPSRWSVMLSNELAKEEMTVDVTPRRGQKFKPQPGDKFKWTNSDGGTGTATADKWGLVTIEQVQIKPGEETRLTIETSKD